jgi:GNAT superfamily N-acetyltransferase
MCPSPRLHVVPLTQAWAERVGALEVGPGQDAYVGSPRFNVVNTLADPRSEGMVVVLGETAIGSYRLDFSPNAITGQRYAAASVGLRAFLIDRRYQGRGLGARAALAMCEDLPARHADRRVLLLAVHCRNRAAVATYRHAGFIDTGRCLAGGRAGPQHLMLRELHPPRAAVAVAGTHMGQWAHG